VNAKMDLRICSRPWVQRRVPLINLSG
jgi:hypothetical protein